MSSISNPASGEPPGHGRGRFWLLFLLLAVYFGLAGAAVNPGHRPFITDEVAYLYQARVFASGRVLGPLPPSVDHFRSEYVVERPRGMSTIYLPFWSAILAIGVAACRSWLVNPAILALVACLAYRHVKRTAGDRPARLALALIALSPAFLLQSAFFQNHPLSALLTLAFPLLLAAGHDLPAGLVLGLHAGVRPLSAAALGLPFALRLAGSGLPRVARVGLGVCVMLAVTLLHARCDSGSWNLTTYGSAVAKVCWSDFSLATALDAFGERLLAFGYDLAIPFCLLFALPILVRRGDGDRLVADLVIGSLVLQAGLFFLAWYDARQPTGARFLFETAPATIMAAAIVLDRLARRLAPRTGALGPAAVAAAVAAGVLVTTLQWGLPRIASVQELLSHAIPAVTARHLLDRPALVFVDESGSTTYHQAFASNDPDLGADVLFARLLGAGENARLRARLPSRTAYLYRVRGLTEDGTLSRFDAGPGPAGGGRR